MHKKSKDTDETSGSKSQSYISAIEPNIEKMEDKHVRVIEDDDMSKYYNNGYGGKNSGNQKHVSFTLQPKAKGKLLTRARQNATSSL